MPAGIYRSQYAFMVPAFHWCPPHMAVSAINFIIPPAIPFRFHRLTRFAFFYSNKIAWRWIFKFHQSVNSLFLTRFLLHIKSEHIWIKHVKTYRRLFECKPNTHREYGTGTYVHIAHTQGQKYYAIFTLWYVNHCIDEELNSVDIIYGIKYL